MLDTNSEPSYNNEIDAIHGVEVVKMDEQRPVNDTECKHEEFVVDPTDTIGEAIYHGCTNPKCGLGFYIKNKNLT